MVKIEVSITDILSYLGDRVRPLKEGEQVFKAGHVIFCGLSDNNTVEALVLQTSAMKESPHEVKITFLETWECVCSCKAGLSGYCKHIVAVLIYLNRFEDVDMASCTDLKQKWGSEKKGVQELYQTEPFENFCHPNLKNKYQNTYSVDSSINSTNFEYLLCGIGNSPLAMLKAGIGKKVESGVKSSILKEPNRIMCSLVDQLFENIGSSTFLKKLEKLNESNYSLEKCCLEKVNRLRSCNSREALKCNQGSKTWHEFRQLRITGSTCYSIYTYGSRGQPDWEKKALQLFFPKGFQNKYTSFGLEQEKNAVETFRHKNPHYEILHASFVLCEMFPWLGFSPDGILFEENRPVALLEIKCPYIGKTEGAEVFEEKCDFLFKQDGKIEIKMNHQYYGQVQLGMALLNLKKTHFVVYSAYKKNYVEIQVNFDENFSEALIKTITEKYFNHLIHFFCLNSEN